MFDSSVSRQSSISKSYKLKLKFRDSISDQNQYGQGFRPIPASWCQGQRDGPTDDRSDEPNSQRQIDTYNPFEPNIVRLQLSP